MRFQERLLLVGLALLIFTLILSSLLSLSSFEKIYSRALIATYEVSGKNLQHKIEASLRFGKPLSGFVAMDKLLAKVREADPVIMRIDVVAADKTVLYSTEELARSHLSPYADHYPSFQRPDAPLVQTRLIQNRYVTFLPLGNKSGEIEGYLNLEFSRAQVNQQLESMALGNLRVLGLIIAASALTLMLALSLGFARPIERRLHAFFDEKEGMTQDALHAPACSDRGADELSRIAVDVQCLLADSRRELQMFEREQEAKAKLLQALTEVEQLGGDLQPDADGGDCRQLYTELSETVRRALGENASPDTSEPV